MSTIATVIPTLGRAHALPALVENIRETSPLHTLLFVVDNDDTETLETLTELPVLIHSQDGTYPVKTNSGFDVTYEPFVLIAGDDAVFHEGWYEAAEKIFTSWPDIGVVGPYDMTPSTEEGHLATMPIVRRTYIENPGGAWGELGTVYWEGYHHNRTDTELWTLACHRGVAMHVRDCVIEHRHPLWGTAEVDDTYRKGGLAHIDEDAELFERRRLAWEAG
jgi:glycosyltransferase involved in cell wall biosynthesis